MARRGYLWIFFSPSMLWFLAICALHGNAVRGQRCEAWDGMPAYCAQFDGYKQPDTYIYVPANTTLTALKERVARAVNVAGALGNDKSLLSQCNRLWAGLNCATHLRPCVAIPALDDELTLLAKPRQPCQGGCRSFAEMCREYLEERNLTLGGSLYYPPGYSQPLTCQEIDTDGQAFYQHKDYAVTLSNNQTYELQCNSLLTNATTFIICEDPLYTVEGSNECGFTCPLPSYTDDQYNTLKVLQLLLGWLSWAGSLIVILSYALQRKLRQFPANLILMTAVAAHLESVGMILPTFFGYDNTWCGFNIAYAIPDSGIEDQQMVLYFDIEDLSMHSGLCAFQGWLLQMGFLSSTMWWGIVAFSMFLFIYFGEKLPNTKTWNVGLQLLFHVCGWAIPIILIFIPAVADEIVFPPGGTFCSLGAASTFFLAFWAIPVGASLIVGTLLFMASLGRLLHLSYLLKEVKKPCGTYYRLILFILIYLILVTFIFSYSLRMASARDTIEDGYAAYYICLLKRQSDCTLSESVHNFGLAVLRSIGYSSLGLLLFCNFCLTPSMARFWWRFLKRIGQGRFGSALVLTSANMPPLASSKSPAVGTNPPQLRDKTATDFEDDDDEVNP